MEERFRCISCNRNDTWASYFCEKCNYSWEEEALFDFDGSIRSASCPMCLKATRSGQVRCDNHACMAVWPAPQPQHEMGRA